MLIKQQNIIKNNHLLKKYWYISYNIYTKILKFIKKHNSLTFKSGIHNIVLKKSDFLTNQELNNFNVNLIVDGKFQTLMPMHNSRISNRRQELRLDNQSRKLSYTSENESCRSLAKQQIKHTLETKKK